LEELFEGGGGRICKIEEIIPLKTISIKLPGKKRDGGTVGK
jgi:hypothetical protein